MTTAFQKVSERNKKIGLMWIVGPLIGLVIVLFSFAISTFIASNLSPTGNDIGGGLLLFKIVKLILGVLGILAVIAIPVGLIAGISYLNKKEAVSGVPYDERSGKKDASEIPNEIKEWNWGAAGLTWIWGAWYGVWLSFLVFIPVVNIVMIFVLGMKGNEWAWRARQWESVEVFKVAQEKWKIWGLIFFVLTILGILKRTMI